MFAYQVCECSTSASPTAAAISRSIAERPQRGVGLGQPGRRRGRRARPASSRGDAEAVHVDVDDAAQLADEELDVHAGAAVDLGRVLPGQHRNPHAADPRPRPIARAR